MKWRKDNDFPDETGEQLCEVIQRPNDPGSKGATSIYPTYVRYIKGWDHWMNPPEGYKVNRWLDESDESPESSELEELRKFKDRVPEGIYSAWEKVHDLEEENKQLKTKLSESSVWPGEVTSNTLWNKYRSKNKIDGKFRMDVDHFHNAIDELKQWLQSRTAVKAEEKHYSANEVGDFLIELYKECEHGDEEHRQWLKDKFQKFFTNNIEVHSVKTIPNE